MEDRKQKEREFHNRRELARLEDQEAHDSYYTNSRFYSITGKSARYWDHWLERCCPGAIALDYCCGTGEMSHKMARLGATVTGIDISEVSIETANAEADRCGLADKINFIVGDAEHTDFADDSFDIVIASGVLHHVDLDAAYAEIARILKPNGSVICGEALAHNPFIMAYRRRTPHLRTAFEVDHILRVSDIKRARKYFRSVDIRFFHLLSIGAIPFRNTLLFRPILAVLEVIDSVLTRIPFLRHHAWQAMFTLANPREDIPE